MCGGKKFIRLPLQLNLKCVGVCVCVCPGIKSMIGLSVEGKYVASCKGHQKGGWSFMHVCAFVCFCVCVSVYVCLSCQQLVHLEGLEDPQELGGSLQAVQVVVQGLEQGEMLILEQERSIRR